DYKLEGEILQLQTDISSGNLEIASLTISLGNMQPGTSKDSDRKEAEARKKTIEYRVKLSEQRLNALKQRTNADPNKPGYFTLRAPISGTVLTSNFREDFTYKAFRPNEQILRVGA